MKSNIHPNWNSNVKVICACGNSFTTGSTLDSIRVDICAKCHPFFTGAQKFVDTLGQVDKFQKKSEVFKEKSQQKAQVLQARAEKIKVEKQEKPTLKELLMQARKNLHS